MKHPRGKLIYLEILNYGEISVFSNLMSPQNNKPNIFLETVASYEALRGKLHPKFSRNVFRRNAFTGFFRSLTGNFRRKLCLTFCCFTR